jgi:cysteine-rich repeat protein
MVCGDDLVDVTAADNPCVGTCGGTPAVCQAATCGDGKVEIGEACDDGNTVPLDGCEPGICVKSKVLKLALGDGHSCALGQGGWVRCWGENTNGELGLGHHSYEGGTEPYLILDTTGHPGVVGLGGIAATDISAGFGFTCALLTGGSVRCWGKNDVGQLGTGNTSSMLDQIAPAINFGSGITATAIGVGMDYACAVLSNGTVRCWGNNNGGQLGLGNTQTVLSGTVALSSGVTPTAVALGSDNACVITSTGAVHCWADNYYGEFGLGNSSTLPDSTGTPPSSYGDAVLKTSRKAITIATGAYDTCAILDDAEMECWGSNNVGQLGLGTTQTIGDNETPSSVGMVGISPVIGIALGSQHTCALLGSGGGLKCWGDNALAELGQGDTVRRGNTNATVPASFQPIAFSSSPSAVYAGNAHTCALLSDGSVRCWGLNDRGQLGLGKVSTSVGGIPAETPDKLPAVQIFAP